MSNLISCIASQHHNHFLIYCQPMIRMGEFDKSTVLISGGSSGIGRATALKFVEAGATVITTSRRKTLGLKIEKELKEFSGDSIWLQADVMSSKEIEQLFATISEHGYHLDIAFNNASAGGGADLVHENELTNWNKTIQGTLTSVYEFMHYELKDMVTHGSGVVINNSSVDGLRAFPFDVAYSAAKHGVIGLTKSAALQYADYHIRINAIAPGWVDTPPVRRMIENNYMPEADMLRHQPMGRLGTSEEIADAVLWLASDRATFVTGTVLAIDGGYTAL